MNSQLRPRNSKVPSKTLGMVYVDYGKAFDSVPYQWTQDVMAAFKISPVIINFLAAAMELWKTDLSLHYEGGCLLAEDALPFALADYNISQSQKPYPESKMPRLLSWGFV